jgi:hypothetical protein
MGNEVIKLAYEEARAALKEQDATLANVRNRAAGLLAAASVVTSLAAAVGLLNVDPDRGPTFPTWAGWALVGLMVLIGAGVMAVLWPSQAWDFGPSPEIILANAEGDDIDAVRGTATEAMLLASKSNDRKLTWRVHAYQATVLVLLLEVVLLMSVLLLVRR